jgi:hypothetical protein
MRLLGLVCETTSAGTDLVARVGVDAAAEPFEVFFQYQTTDPTFVSAEADALAAAMLLPAMRRGERLAIPAPIAPLLCFNLPRIRDIFHTWWPEFPSSELCVTPRVNGADAPAPRAATFFSGGVDSFYSLLKHRHGFGTLPAPLTHVIFMGGVETRLERTKGRDESQRWVEAVAGAVGVQCIFGASNIRTRLQGPETNLLWDRHYHGSALAAIALTLSGGLGYVCIPSAFSYNHLVAHGSTALVDEMYSTERLRIVHDGSEVSRAMKVARILEWDRDLVLSHLRVCFENYGGAFNCGRCYKCVRTAIPLRILGVWDQARTFPEKTMDHWEAAASQDHLPLTEENLQLARERGAEARLVSMLDRVVQRRRRKENAREFIRNSPLERLVPVARRLRSRLP